MAFRTKDFIEKFLDENLHRFDSPQQYLGGEPNTYNKDWDASTVRWNIVASWPYVQSAGNQSIPAVYQAINLTERFMADRFYLPATPKDLKILERHDVPVFGIESKRQLQDFDVVGTSISYPVLIQSFVKMLMMSDIPVRWKARQQRPEAFPMVIVGGQSFAAPEALAPMVDAVWCGEVEEEPGNGGIASLTLRIEDFKIQGLWSTDREECYKRLAREFHYLYFPRFVDVEYEEQDRGHEFPSKQVSGLSSGLLGMRYPVLKRHVKNINNIVPLYNKPLPFVGAAQSAGDLEVARGCAAWCVSQEEYVLIEGRGHVQIKDLQLSHEHPKDLRISSRGSLEEVTCAVSQGTKELVRIKTNTGHHIDVTPDHEILVHQSPYNRNVEEWKEAKDLVPGDTLPIRYGAKVFGSEQSVGGMPLTEDLSWLIGFLVGAGSIHPSRNKKFTGSWGWGTLDGSTERDTFLTKFRATFPNQHLSESRVQKSDIIWSRAHNQTLFNGLTESLGYSHGRATEDSKLHVPEQVMQGTEAVQKAFLNGLFEADGNIDADGKFLRLVTISERLAREVSLLLLNIGLRTSWHGKKVQSDRGLVRSGRGYAYHVNVRRGLDGDMSWWSFGSRLKTERLHLLQTPMIITEASHPFQKSRTSPMRAKVVSVEPVDKGLVADFMVPSTGAFDASGITIHNCSFCALTFRTKPYRQRDIEYVTQYASDFAKHSGSIEVIPFSPDFPMHTQRKTMVRELLKVSDQINAPAMRVDDFLADKEFIALQGLGGLKSASLGVEGNSQRMRDLVGKGASDHDIREAVRQGMQAGIGKFKLFMISNMPGEDEHDVRAAIRLANDLCQIRDDLGKPNIRIQFSWSPLLIEAGTPFQWFSPSANSRAISDVWDELREVKVQVKLGGKAEINKATLFQLCQRASREVGEVIIDVFEATAKKEGGACWGGVAKKIPALGGISTYDALEQGLVEAGFKNGYEDCFDERFKDDLFGWEFIDSGVDPELLWRSYSQMVEFLEQTDSQTYDAALDANYHGSEWLPRCDDVCLGSACGNCDQEDLALRKDYIDASDDLGDVGPIDLSDVEVVDERSVATKVRVRVFKDEAHRSVGNGHWRFAVRRALFLTIAEHFPEATLNKRSIKFVSDTILYRDWTHGTDYCEFSMSTPMTELSMRALVRACNHQLSGLRFEPESLIKIMAGSRALKTDADLSLWEIGLDCSLSSAVAALRTWDEQEAVPMTLRAEEGYFTAEAIVVDAKEYCAGMWLVPEGRELKLKMLLRGRPSPHDVVVALFGLKSWSKAGKLLAKRLETFVESVAAQEDFLRPRSLVSGGQVPSTLFGESFHDLYTPFELDRVERGVFGQTQDFETSVQGFSEEPDEVWADALL